jgi:hypothetical protein
VKRSFRAVAITLIAIWMAPAATSFAVGVHLLLEHHHHHGPTHDRSIEHPNVEDAHHHDLTVGELLHDVIPSRRILDATTSPQIAPGLNVDGAAIDTRAATPLHTPPRGGAPPAPLLHILCTLLI